VLKLHNTLDIYQEMFGCYIYYLCRQNVVTYILKKYGARSFKV